MATQVVGGAEAAGAEAAVVLVVGQVAGVVLAMRSLYAMMARARLAQWPQTDQHDLAVRTARHPCAQMGRTYLCVLVPHATLVQ